MAASELVERVPPHLVCKIPQFWECLGCNIIVWKGMQYETVKATFKVRGSGAGR